MAESLPLDIDGYRAGMVHQLAALRAALDAGMPRFGWKVGLNVPEIQERMGLASAGMGWLDGRRVFESGALLEAAEDRRLLVEAERAVRIGAAVSLDATVEEARAAIEAVAPALELVDYAQPAKDVDAIVGHSMFHFGSVLGGPVDPAALVGLGKAHPIVGVGGDGDGGGGGEAKRGPRGDLVPADPAESVLFCARYLAAFGEALAAGDWILCGSYTPPVPLAPGQRFEADFGPDVGTLSIALAEAR